MGKRHNGSFCVNRGISEDMKVVRSWLSLVTLFSPRGMVTSGPGLLLGLMSRLMALM